MKKRLLFILFISTLGACSPSSAMEAVIEKENLFQIFDRTILEVCCPSSPVEYVRKNPMEFQWFTELPMELQRCTLNTMIDGELAKMQTKEDINWIRNTLFLALLPAQAEMYDDKDTAHEKPIRLDILPVKERQRYVMLFDYKVAEITHEEIPMSLRFFAKYLCDDNNTAKQMVLQELSHEKKSLRRLRQALRNKSCVIERKNKIIRPLLPYRNDQTYLKNIQGTIAYVLENIPSSRNSDVKSVTYFCFSNKQLTTIHTDSFKNFENLQALDLSNNQLVSFHPNAFSGLSKLSALNLDNNKLSKLPDVEVINLINELKKLPSLQWLYLKENGLKKITRKRISQALNPPQQPPLPLPPRVTIKFK